MKSSIPGIVTSNVRNVQKLEYVDNSLMVPRPHFGFIPATSLLFEEVKTVVEASGATWIDLSRDETVDFIVVDLTSDDGLSTLATIKTEGNHFGISVIALVSVDSSPSESDLAKWGIDEFVNVDSLKSEFVIRLSQMSRRKTSLQDIQKREQDLSHFLRLTSEYTATLDMEKLLHQVTHRLTQQMNIERAALIVLDEKQNAGFIVASSDDAALKQLRIDLLRYPEVREAARTGKPFTIENATAGGPASLAALPMMVQGRVLGVLLVHAFAHRKGFSPAEIDFLATVAQAIGVALRNARLIESVKGQTEIEKTARIAAEERATHLKRYESYFAHVSDGIAILDERAEVLSLNPAGGRILEVTPKKVLGKHIHSLTRPLNESILLDALWLFGRDPGETRKDFDFEIRTVTGLPLTLSMSVAALDEGGAAAILSFRDVTRARAVENELRRTKEFLERLIDSSVDAIIAADMTGKVIVFNKGAEAISGYSVAEALAHLSTRQLYPPGIARQVMGKLREGGGRMALRNTQIVSKGEGLIPVNLTASMVYEGKREIATLGIFGDLRESMKLQQQLSAAENRLEQSEQNAVLVALAGTAAHELNQPLTAVMGYAELLKRKLVETDFAFRPVDIIFREAERMAEIVKKIGKITRFETKTYVGDSLIVDLDRAILPEEQER